MLPDIFESVQMCLDTDMYDTAHLNVSWQFLSVLMYRKPQVCNPGAYAVDSYKN